MKRIALVLVALLSCLALAGKSDDTLNVAFERTMLTFDTFATSERLALILAHNWGDTLIHRDPETGEFQPHLATSWKFLDDTRLQLDLQTGVKFHNGEVFGPDDVKATFDYVTGSGAELPGSRTLQWIESVEVIDDDTVVIHAKEVTPTALETLALVGVIYPAGYLAAEGPGAMGSAPVGTGPYRFMGRSDNEARFEAFGDYFGGAKGQPGVGKLVIKTMPEESSRIAALRTGEIDIARSGSISPDQGPSVRGRARVEGANILRSWYLQMDALGTSGVDYFTDAQVRRAINHAINKQEIVEILLSGNGQVIDTPCNPVQFGCDPAAAAHYEYDPELARELLSRAGYPNGFSVDLYAYRDQQVAQAIQGYLQEVGIDTELRWFGGQYDVVSQRQEAGELPMFFGSWGSSSIYDASSILDIFFKSDETYSYNDSATIDGALDGALQTVDLAERRRLYAQAIEEITGEAYWVPLYTGRVLAGVSNDLDWQPSSDEIERYYRANWR
jgi:peptide/nickel transport system substrate-binding protein